MQPQGDSRHADQSREGAQCNAGENEKSHSKTKEVWHFKSEIGFNATAVAFSPDGNSLVSVGKGPAVRVWDVSTGKERWQILQLDDWVLCAAFSPNGRVLAVGTGRTRGGDVQGHVDEQGPVYLLEADTGRERCRFNGHLGSVMSVAFSPDGLLLASAAADSTSLVWDVTGRVLGAGRAVKLLGAKDLDACWVDLAGDDGAKAWQAILALAARPEQAVPFLKQRLPANPKLDPKRLACLLAGLDSDDFNIREQASKELTALGPAAAPALRRLHASGPSVDMQRRVEELLGKPGKGGILAEELRCTRAVEVLEYVATPEARQLLEAEAKGEPESQLTQGARAALDRLAKRLPAKP